MLRLLNLYVPNKVNVAMRNSAPNLSALRYYRFHRTIIKPPPIFTMSYQERLPFYTS